MEKSEQKLQICLTTWINHILKPKNKVVTDLLYDLRNGDLLRDVIKILQATDEEIVPNGVSSAANVTNLLGYLQKERVKFDSELVTCDKIVQGDPAATVHLIWSVAFHYESRQTLESLSLPSQLVSPNIEWILQAWVSSVVPHVANITTDLADGQVLATLVLNHQPVTKLSSLLENQAAECISDHVVRIISHHFSIPPLLTLPDVTDKRISILYLLILARQLSPTITLDMISGNSI